MNNKKIILIITMICCAFFIVSCGNTMTTKKEVEKINEGMTYSEICEILGEPGKDVGSGAIIYEWNFEKDKYLQIWFMSPSQKESKIPDDLVAIDVRINTKALS